MSTPPGFTRIGAPIPDWQYGQRVDATESGRQYLAGAEAGFHIFDPCKANEREIFSILLTGVTPRPIAIISTRGPDGIDNVAPFSFFNIACVDPPLVSIAAIYEKPYMKDTARNILATKNFVVNITSAAWIHQANATSMDSPYGQTEWGWSGLTKQSSDLVSAPRIKECAFALECELYEHFQIKNATGTPSTEMIFGIIRRIHLRKDMLLHSPNSRMPQVNSQRLNPVSRLGEITYATLGHGFRVIVPKWRTESEIVQKEFGDSESKELEDHDPGHRYNYPQAKL